VVKFMNGLRLVYPAVRGTQGACGIARHQITRSRYAAQPVQGECKGSVHRQGQRQRSASMAWSTAVDFNWRNFTMPAPVTGEPDEILLARCGRSHDAVAGAIDTES